MPITRVLPFDVGIIQVAVSVKDQQLSRDAGMTPTNADRMAEARQLVARALALAVEADETLAAAELEQALDILSRYEAAGEVSSGVPGSRPLAIQ